MMSMQSIPIEEILDQIDRIHESFYHQMMDPEKNGYDPEVQLPTCPMLGYIPLKKEYSMVNKVNDTARNLKRRKEYISKLVEHIINGKLDDARTMIKKHYYASIAEISKEADAKILCCQRTASNYIAKLSKLIGYDGELLIPDMLTDDIIECINEWVPCSKYLYECCKHPEKVLDILEEKHMINLFHFYIFTKKLLLINCNSKQEYEEQVAQLHKNNRINAVYNAVRTII